MRFLKVWLLIGALISAGFAGCGADKSITPADSPVPKPSTGPTKGSGDTAPPPPPPVSP